MSGQYLEIILFLAEAIIHCTKLSWCLINSFPRPRCFLTVMLAFRNLYVLSSIL